MRPGVLFDPLIEVANKPRSEGVNLVPKVSHLTAPWGERGETVLAPGGCKMRLRDWHLFVVRCGSNHVWSGTR